MSLKSNNAKKFVKDTGTKNQLFVFVGSDNSQLESNSSRTDLDLWKKSDFSVRVGQNSVLPIIPTIRWTQKRPYTPWSATEQNRDAFYAYNDQNQYVYLCISDNGLNRKDLRGTNVSNIRPTHTVGAQKYADGYVWKPLYKITPSLQRFLNADWMPVVSFELFDSENQKTQLEQTQEFCDNSTTEIGKCAIYAKKALSTDNIAGTIEYAAGALFTTAPGLCCGDCYYLMKDNDKFTTRFYSTNETVPTSIVIRDEYEQVGELIQQNQVSTASPYYYLYQTNTNDNVEEGSVISAFIDLSGLTPKDLIVTTANPELLISSNSGIGARIRLLTKLENDTYFIDGIEVVEPGSGYTDISIGITASILVNASIETIVSKISVNLDVVDGLAFDPVTVLNAQHVMIDARLDKTSIETAGILLPESVNFFSLVENPKGISGSQEVTSGSNLNKKLDYIFRTTTKIKTTDAVVASIPDEDIIFDEPVSTLTNTNPNVKSTKVIVSAKVSDGSDYISELKNIEYGEADFLLNTIITKDESSEEVIEILEKPVFVQNTGKVLSTTKLSSALPIADVDSVIIRINMVKGM